MPVRASGGGGRFGISGSQWTAKGIRNFEIGVKSNSRSIGSAMAIASKVAEDIPAEMIEEIADEQLELTIRYSSGSISQARLRQFKPGKYSTKRPSQKRDYIINAHVGTFRAGWRKRRVMRQGKKFFVSLFNAAMPVAAFLLLGTRKMRDRPLLQQVVTDTRKLVNQVMSRARMRVLRAIRRASKAKRAHR
jgi:hypothetical protein